VPGRVTTLRRIVHEASFVASSCLRAMGGARPDVFMTVSPPLGLALTSILLGRAWRRPYVYHVPDLQPDAAVDLGMLPKGPMVRMLYGLERLAYRNAALVSTLTSAMRTRIVSKGIPAERVTLFPDWCESDLFELPLEGGGREARSRFGLDGRFLVVHVGNMGVKQGLDVVLDAAERSRRHPDILYLLIGDGAMRQQLVDGAARRGLDNVRILPLQPIPIFRELLSAIDVTLVTQQRVVADIVFPSKMLTLLAAGRPVVASVSPGSEVARVVREARAGLVVPPGDPDALVEAVLRLRDEERRVSMSVQGRAYARANWDREKILSDMERELHRLAARRGTPSSGPVRAPDETSSDLQMARDAR
jgi:colanic acid biosynthesis glycosyl transferase WcaI